MTEKIRHYFKNPPNEFRAKPFWAWNGNLEKKELKRQIDIMKEMGYGGYFMHSRVGLATEYLSDEWFDMINFCADYGNTLGMESWIYDEDRWPSGYAGGKASNKKENRMKYLRMSTDIPKQGNKIVAAFRCRVENENVYDIYEVDVSDKNANLFFDIIEFSNIPAYNGTFYIDTMKKEATEEFIQCTHEQYAKKCAGRLGNSIKGVFTDEPHRGELMLSVTKNGIDLSSCVPYTDNLFEIFKKMWGYSLKNRLPALFLRENGEKVAQIKWHFCETLQRLFLDNYITPISKWCKLNNMTYTGHLLHEDSLSAQTLMNGSLMRGYELMDNPGVDVLWGETNKCYNIVKQLSSVGNQCDKKWLLSEMYGITGWHMTLEDYKKINDWQALMGINVRCPHMSWYTMKGECKRDYPASIFYQSSWYKEYKYLEDYYARIGVFASKGKEMSKVLVINPVESMWCRINTGWAKWICSSDEECIEIENAFESLYRYMFANDIYFDYGDEEMLSRLGKISKNELIVGKASYNSVVIPHMTTIRSTTLKLLEEFQNSGGTIVTMKQPQYVDAIAHEVNLGNSDMQTILNNRILIIDNPAILSTTKISEDGTYYVMLLNTDYDNIASGKFIAPAGNIKRWYPETGEIKQIKRNETITLNAGEIQLLEISNSIESVTDDIEETNIAQISLSEQFTYEINEPNVLVLDRAECNAQGIHISDDVLKIDRKLREMAGIPYRGGGMYQPWYIIKNGVKDYFSYELKFTFNSEIETDAHIASEDIGSIEFNGRAISFSDEWWIDECFKKAKIKIKKGENIITVRNTLSDLSNAEAVYVLGDFGVYDGMIKEKPSILQKGDITKQGYPFYGGKITYIFKQKVDRKSLLQFDNLGGAAAINVNSKTIAWKPYQVVVEPCDEIRVELALTRRNTFGPLHDLTGAPAGCGPTSFLTTGNEYSEYPILIPCGLGIDTKKKKFQENNN